MLGCPSGIMLDAEKKRGDVPRMPSAPAFRTLASGNASKSLTVVQPAAAVRSVSSGNTSNAWRLSGKEEVSWSWRLRPRCRRQKPRLFKWPQAPRQRPQCAAALEPQAALRVALGPVGPFWVLYLAQNSRFKAQQPFSVIPKKSDFSGF